MNKTRKELSGIGVCDSIGMGKAVVIRDEKPDYEKNSRLTADEEKKRYSAAEKGFQAQLEKIIGYAKKYVGDTEADILESQLILSRDTSLRKQADEYMEAGHTAEYALNRVCMKYISSFTDSGEPLLREKAADMQDILKGMMDMISGGGNIRPIDIPDGSVIVGQELSPSLITLLYNKKILGVVTESGGLTGHAALVARSLMIPAVFSVKGVTRFVISGQDIIVNGREGRVFINPTEEDKRISSEKKKSLEDKLKVLQKYKDLPTRTADGVSCRVMCNIGSVDDFRKAQTSGGEGIGLFRTEFFFQSHFTEPTEEEQFETYKSVVLGMKEKEVVIRTLDLGGDKIMPIMTRGSRGRVIQEKNPFLGLRGIRLSLAYRDRFAQQVRAVMRAAVFGNVSMMIPFVTNIEELRETRRIISQSAKELSKEGKEFREDIPVGIMIETPSAVLIAPDLAREADFFSIGSNDLIQYMMCAERDNTNVEYLSSVFEPAVLRCIFEVIGAAHEQGIRVAICGEAALEKKLIPLLLAWGIDDFSVIPNGVVNARSEIARWKKTDTEKIAFEVLSMSSRQQIEEYLRALI
ncbi:MAG: phosphoenolpyruvate--protein phosphotransferase [Lachnospiraceae bacterium]|nr:phosphoenolpyruvate--protein phosphotransferase [Lachnospiraceae bacterium]